MCDNTSRLPIWGFFAKEPYKRDYILQKRATILRSLLIVATPYGVATISRPLKMVSFEKEPYKKDYVLQKRPIFLWSLLIEATPYPICRAFKHKSPPRTDQYEGIDSKE